MRKLFYILSILILLQCGNVKAENRDGFIANPQITIDGKETSKLSDNDYSTFENIESGNEIRITSSKKIEGIYIIYYMEASLGVLKSQNTFIEIGNEGFLHEFIELDKSSTEIVLKYEKDTTIKEIFLFESDAPDWVQKWKPPHKDADILLFSTHSDDEHLFFAGLIPSMVAAGKKMQVVYMTRHDKTPIRFDELLNGLWAVGLENYPVIGIIPDKYSKELNVAIEHLSLANLSLDDVIDFEVDIIRRFKPEVVVSHDENGEYGHGQHRLTTYALENSIKYLNDENYKSEYAPFEPSKIYIHLYKNNPIKMNYDIPLEYFGGKTAYEMSKMGFIEHESQRRAWFTRWLEGNDNNYKSATEIVNYSPLDYGLYYSTVGYENEDNNMFYNIPEPIIEETEEIDEEGEEKNEHQKKEENRDNRIFKIVLVIVFFSLLFLDIKEFLVKRSKKRK